MTVAAAATADGHRGPRSPNRAERPTVHTADLNYELPPERIAQTPAHPRDAARLMVVHRDDETLEHRRFRDLLDYLGPDDLLVANDSRVLPARLHGVKADTGGRVEVLLLHREGERTWETLVRGRVRAGTRLALGAPRETDKTTANDTAPADRQPASDDTPAKAPVTPAKPPVPTDDVTPPAEPIGAEVIALLSDGRRRVRFDAPIRPRLETLGETPLPPYIHQPLDDPERYQTVYAQAPGSAAAPTAGLHFTPGLIDRLTAAGIGWATVTLHVGLDTFRPIDSATVEAHTMHSEWINLPADTADAINKVNRAGRGRTVAVGTTAVRVLETAARKTAPPPALAPWSGWTDLFLTPGAPFHAVDALITNFHLPRSTLLLLVAAFAGKELMERAYQAAIDDDYRFYSFGDAMLIL